MVIGSTGVYVYAIHQAMDTQKKIKHKIYFKIFRLILDMKAINY